MTSAPTTAALRTMLADLPSGVPVLATTATANARVTADVAEQLGTGGGTDALVLRGPLDRESLSLGVLELPDAAHRMAWLADHLIELPGSGIIYTLTVAAAEEVTAFLRQCGHTVTSYTGKTENADRQQAEEDLLANRVKALVATSALGMGFDKPDLGFVVHLGSPSSPIAYYQQVGRAGRGVEHAEVLLLPGKEDQAIWEYFASVAFPRRNRCAAPSMSSRTRSDRCPSPPSNHWWSCAAPGWRRCSRSSTWTVRSDASRAAGSPPAPPGRTTPSAMPGSPSSAPPSSRPCVSTSRRRVAEWSSCGGSWTTRKPSRADGATPARSPGSRIPSPLRHWTRRVASWGARVSRSSPARCGRRGSPAVGVNLKGRIPAGEQAAPGRALGRLSDIGWGNRLRPMLAPQAPDGPVPDDVAKAVVAVLADWAKGPGGWASGGPTPSPARWVSSRWRPVPGRS